MRVEARERRVELHGLTLRVREWPTDGPPIVLVHGLASNSRIWDDVAGILARSYHLVALDQRGHGLSDRPTDGFSFERVVGDLHGVISALDLERPTLVGTTVPRALPDFTWEGLRLTRNPRPVAPSQTDWPRSRFRLPESELPRRVDRVSA